MLYNEKIREIRQKNKTTQESAAQVLGITQQQYFKYEKGINEMPIRYITVLCKYFNVSADYILGLPEGMPYGYNKT